MIYAPMLKINNCILKKCTPVEIEKLYGSDYGYELTCALRDFGKFNDINEKLDEEGKLNIYYCNACLDWIVYFDDKVIGNIVVENYNKENKSMNFSYYIDDNNWSLCKDLIIELLDYLFKNLDIENIIYVSSGSNAKEKELMTEIGFEFLSMEESIINDKLNIKEIIYKSLISKKIFYDSYSSMKENKQY